MNDPVKTPSHYRQHPSGVECKDITKHMSFTLGNALKYIWRCDLKKDAIEDLEKAREYLLIEINTRKEAKRKEDAKRNIAETAARRREAERVALYELQRTLYMRYGDGLPRRYLLGMDAPKSRDVVTEFERIYAGAGRPKRRPGATFY